MENSADAIKKIEEMAGYKHLLHEVDGKTYSTENLHRVFSDPRPSQLRLSSLSGLVDYINQNIDGVHPAECVLHIESPREVTIYGPVQGEKNDRHIIASANLDKSENGMTPFRFGDWLGQEDFIIALLTQFEQTPDLAVIKTAVAVMVAKVDASQEDDGAGAKKKVSSEVVLNGPVPPGVVRLKPFRTFRQVEQPESAFIFRYTQRDGGVKCALMEADGGAWKHAAVENIQGYLRGQLSETPIFT